ncbi:MAG: hypothetical protein H0V70_26555 [Ktedonobacteraceae bacterium]|nr:hypothetical protein [Ktedonobacteraceae bacterium]
MNLLVAGGLLLFGVIALVAVVFVIRSEPATKEAISVPPPVPTEQEEPETHAIADESLSSEEVPGTPDKETMLVAENHAINEWQPLASGQLYELKNELRSLHEQAQGLEQRLQNLVHMIERIEQGQDGRSLAEGQPSDATSIHATR